MVLSGRRPRRGTHLLEIAIVEWQLLGECDSGTTICTDSATMRRKKDLRKMSVLIDIKIIQTKGGVSYLSTKAHREYGCTEGHFEELTALHFWAIWEMVIDVIAALVKTRGYEFHQAVLGKVRP
jgi:hypothetical protein